MNEQLSNSAQSYISNYLPDKYTWITYKCLKYKTSQTEMILLIIPAFIIYTASMLCSLAQWHSHLPNSSCQKNGYDTFHLFLYCSFNPINHHILSIQLFNSLSNEMIFLYHPSHDPSRSYHEYFSQHFNSLLVSLPSLWSLLIFSPLQAHDLSKIRT